MTHKLRVEYPHAIYHTMNSGCRRERVAAAGSQNSCRNFAGRTI